MNIIVNHIKIYYQKIGTGEPLILLHGNRESSEIFDQIIPILSKHFTVYAIDSRNHGKSGQSSELSYELMRDDLLAFIEALGLNKVHVLGFSDGAITALMAAIKCQNLFSTMTLAGVNVSISGLKKRFINQYHQSESLYDQLMFNQKEIPSDALKTIHIPVLLVIGEYDVILRSHVQKIARSLEKATLIILKGHDHSSYVIHEPDLAQLCLEFIKK